MINQQYVGWVQAFFSVLILWGLNNVMIGYSAQILNANYVIYTCCAFASCSLLLLVVSGPGKLGKETLRSIDTWLFGLIMLLGYIVTLALFSVVSSTEGSLLQRISLFFGVFASWMFLHRTPNKNQLLGLAIVLTGVAIICKDIPEEKRGVVYFLMLLEGMVLSARMFVAEMHRPHNQALNSRDGYRSRCRVVGFVMFIMSMVFMGVSLIVALLNTIAPLPFESNIIPTLASLTHTPSILAGLVAGVFLVAPLRIIEFSSTSLIKTENFLAVAALSSIATYFWEWLLSPLTGMELKLFSRVVLLAILLITIGSMIAVLKGRKSKLANLAQYLDIKPQDPYVVSDSRDILAETLSHFDGSMKKSAQALKLPQYVLQALLDDDSYIYAFKSLDKVQRRFRSFVAGTDALTELLNRSSFKLKGREFLETQKSVKLFYIDLDKFKPINDTYGHDAGDAVLVDVSRRLQDALPEGALAARMGGDEFCALLSTRKKSETVI
ncbi:MAG: diguanylate cyclase, partial [Alphaproteobacteria bacterium]|nr:diguanylate cyclase [Alphaproteobacteria bacterium]